MHEFTLSSGRRLFYDVRMNTICLGGSFAQANFISHFSEPDDVGMSDIALFTVELTQQCNLRCDYCCFSGSYQEFRSHRQLEMSHELMQHCVDFISQNASQQASEITICFYGGETLLALEKMKWMVEHLLEKLGDKAVFSISTNGYALTDAVVDWICNIERCYVNITVDGDRTMHDAHRKTRGGRGSYETIIGNLRRFRERYPKEYTERLRILSTVLSWEDVRRMSKEWNCEPALQAMHPVHISHIIPNFNDSSRTYDNRETKDRFFADAMEHYKRGDEDIMVEALLNLVALVARRKVSAWGSEQRLVTCLQDMHSCFINVMGELYACEKFGQLATLGSVYEGFDRVKMLALQQSFTELKRRHCTQCWARRLCRMCLTAMNFRECDLPRLCEMERDTLDVALKYFCEIKDWEASGNVSASRHPNTL